MVNAKSFYFYDSEWLGWNADPEEAILLTEAALEDVEFDLKRLRPGLTTQRLRVFGNVLTI